MNNKSHCRSHHKPRLTKTIPFRLEHGNMLALAAVMVLGVLGLILFFTLNLGRLFGTSMEHKTATETASLAAATQLSRIVIPDSNFGWISLSDYPPVGTATIAGDGEPLPVAGINTVIGTARLDWIMANELNNPTIKTLAGLDVARSKQAAENLTKVLKASLSPNGHPLAIDLNGHAVKPYESAKSIYESSLVRLANGGKPVEGTFKLSLGWLEGGSRTNTHIPRPESMAKVSANQKIGSYYKAFVNIPAFGKDFYFAGADEEPSLVDVKRFREDDGSRPASIVKVEADHEMLTTGGGKNNASERKIIHTVSCAQPYAQKDTAPPGNLTIGFPSGPVKGIERPLDLSLDPDFAAAPTPLLSPKGGDWPTDSQGEPGILSPVTMPGTSTVTPTASQIWSAGMYHWLRNGRTDPDLESVKEFEKKAFGDMGNIGERKKLSFNPFSLPAYANHKPDLRIVGIFSGSPGDSSDPRHSIIDPNKTPTQTDIAAFQNISMFRDMDETLPANVLVVGLDEEGNVYSADGKNKLTIDDIYRFWRDLKATNAAALATMAMANQIKQQAPVQTSNQVQINSLGQLIQQKQTQLRDDTTLSGTQYHALQEEIAALEQQLAQLINTPATTTTIPEAVEIAYNNGKRTAMITGQIAAHQRLLTSQGLSVSGQDFKLAGQKFVSHPNAPTSLDAILNGRAPSGGSENTDWTSPKFNVYEMPSGGPVAYSPPNTPGWAIPIQAASAAKSVPADESRTYLFEFSPKGEVVATVLPANPFLEINVSQDQWFALSLNAKTTNKSTLPVSWLFAARDQTVNRGISGKKENKHGGQPLPSNESKWCTSEKYGNGRSKGRGSKGSKGSKGSFLMPDPMQPAFAGSGGSRGSGGQGQGQGKGQARRSYYCGGSSSDFQLRAPIVANGGLPKGKTPNVQPIGNVAGKPASGPATVSVAGIKASIPNTLNWSVTAGQAPVSEPGAVMAPGATQPTELCPPPPATFL